MTLPTPYLWQREVYAAWTGWIQNAPCLLLLTCGWVKPTALTCHSATAMWLHLRLWQPPLPPPHTPTVHAASLLLLLVSLVCAGPTPNNAEHDCDNGR